MNLRLLLLLLLPISLFSCKKGGDDAHDAEMRKLNAWLQVNNITATPTASGLYIIPVVMGNGVAPVDLNYAYINYSVELLDGTIIYSTDSLVADNWGLEKRYYASELTRLGLSSNIQPGIAEAIWKMKVGGKVRLFMTSNLAYGLNGLSNIGLPLVVNLELVSAFGDIAKSEKDSVAIYKAKYSLTETFDGKDGIYYKKIIQQDTCKGKYLKDYAKSVKVWYVGRFLNGYIFDTNIDSVATKAGITVSSTSLFNVEFGKNGAVVAFEEVVKNMWLQEKTTLVTTSEFAYGAIGEMDASKKYYLIPPYSQLVFEITIDKTYVKK